MPHIDLPKGVPGIRGPMMFRPDTAETLNQLAERLLHAPGPLSPGERELIATLVSARNDCTYCQTIHGAVAAQHLGNEAVVAQVKADFENADVSPKLKALLAIAAKVQKSGKSVVPDDVARARAQGATDREIHDTVLIAAAFCMFNRYVDGLGTHAPDEPRFYRDRAATLARDGYVATNGDIKASGSVIAPAPARSP
jgi:uncharacterized peroxidase-related enzyme